MEEEHIQQIIDELKAFTRENWLPGSAQRFGNTKTFGVLRAEFTVLPDLPETLHAASSRSRRRTRPGSASQDLAPTRRLTSKTSDSARSPSK